jgi:hypothetical protein
VRFFPIRKASVVTAEQTPFDNDSFPKRKP